VAKKGAPTKSLAQGFAHAVQEPGDFNSYYYKAPRTIIAGFGDSALAERTSAGLVPVVALERPDTVTSFRELR
jgi:hypothetical protein